MDASLSARREVHLPGPWLNAAGFLGAYPPAGGWGWPQAQSIFVTAPISRQPRLHPAAGSGVIAYPGGCLLHTGWPNPGFRQVLKQHARRWTGAALPVWAHLLAESPDALGEMAAALETIENVAAVELGLPPGLPLPDCRPLVAAAQGELPLVVCLPLDLAAPAAVEMLAAAGASAVVLCGPRGCLPDPHTGRLTAGRLYGPALFPQALAALRALRPSPIPLIAGCGIFTMADGERLLASGASAVQVDVALWGIRERRGEN